MRSPMILLLLFVYACCSSRCLAREDNSEGRETLNELLDIFLENVKSIRTYDVSIKQTMIYDPVEKDPRFTPFLRVAYYRLVMDWENERTSLITYSYDEHVEADSRVRESFEFDKFDQGVWTSRGNVFPDRPQVKNIVFAAFLRKANIPYVEKLGLRTFPGFHDLPHEQGIEQAKKVRMLRFVVCQMEPVYATSSRPVANQPSTSIVPPTCLFILLPIPRVLVQSLKPPNSKKREVCFDPSKSCCDDPYS